MKRKEKIINLRDRGAAAVAGIATFLTVGSTASAQSAQEGLNKAVPVGSENAVNIFSDDPATPGIFERVVNLLLFLVGAISVIMLIIGGIRYIVSSGDQNQVTGAKNTIMYAIIGIVVAVLAYGIVNFLLGRLYNSVP